MLAVLRRYEGDPTRLAIAETLGTQVTQFLDGALNVEQPASGIDPSPFLVAAEKEHGPLGLQIGSEFLESINAYLYQNPFNRIRRVEWSDLRDLDDLFRSERLDTEHGEFFDQRFGDFLDANFDDIDHINWRQFEGLAAEFFDRLGFGVALGPGRNDNGVDIRLWPTDERMLQTPAVVLVQCKRELRKIDKTVVKALWADVVEEEARGGLIVTSSSFSPGAGAMSTARGYPVAEADRRTLKQWLRAMRTPGSGIFLGD